MLVNKYSANDPHDQITQNDCAFFECVGSALRELMSSTAQPNKGRWRSDSKSILLSPLPATIRREKARESDSISPISSNRPDFVVCKQPSARQVGRFSDKSWLSL